jgi:CMP-N,N'-diacetyllegionaminic acid synthase
MYYLGLIPARGGSKGVPGKNIRMLRGKPLIAYTIEAAQASRRLHRTVVSTDDDDIKRVAEACGAELPFQRPAICSTDNASAIDVMQQALGSLKLPQSDTAIVYLQPTSPMRDASDIDNAIELFEESDADTLVTVMPVPHQYGVESQMEIEDQKLHRIISTPVPLRRQEKPQRYARNGPAILICRAVNIARDMDFYDPSLNIVPMIMPTARSQDIDSEIDFCITEALMNFTGKTHET